MTVVRCSNTECHSRGLDGICEAEEVTMVDDSGDVYSCNSDSSRS